MLYYIYIYMLYDIYIYIYTHIIYIYIYAASVHQGADDMMRHETACHVTYAQSAN